MSDHDKLESRLTELGPQLDFPEPVDLRTAVQRRIVPAPTPPGLARGWRSRVLWGAAAIVLVITLVLAVSPPARRAVADLIGIPGVVIRQEERTTPSLPPFDIGRLQLGDPVTIETASRRAGFDVVQINSPGFGEPEGIFFSAISGGRVSSVYRPRRGLPPTSMPEIGLLLTQFEADIDAAFIEKSVGSGTRLTAVTVGNDWTGYWIEGKPHSFVYRAPSGQIREETLRLAGNTLLLERDGVTVRIESALTKDEVMKLASTLR